VEYWGITDCAYSRAVDSDYVNERRSEKERRRLSTDYLAEDLEIDNSDPTLKSLMELLWVRIS
jgi:hypothetical protein